MLNTVDSIARAGPEWLDGGYGARNSGGNLPLCPRPKSPTSRVDTSKINTVSLGFVGTMDAARTPPRAGKRVLASLPQCTPAGSAHTPLLKVIGSNLTPQPTASSRTGCSRLEISIYSFGNQISSMALPKPFWTGRERGGLRLHGTSVSPEPAGRSHTGAPDGGISGCANLALQAVEHTRWMSSAD